MHINMKTIVFAVNLFSFIFGRPSCDKQSCGDRRVPMPLIDDSHAPLVAMLDMSKVSQNLEQFIEKEIDQKQILLEEEKLTAVTNGILEKMNASLNSVKLDTEDKISSITEELKNKQNIIEEQPPIVFLALLKKPIYGTIQSGQIVKFEQVMENVGNGYDKSTGVFTVPIKGLYHITVGSRQSNTGYLHLGLFRNNEQITISVGRNYNSLTISVPLILSENDRVYVKNSWTKPSGIIGDGQSYFSGYLVQRLL